MRARPLFDHVPQALPQPRPPRSGRGPRSGTCTQRALPAPASPCLAATHWRTPLRLLQEAQYTPWQPMLRTRTHRTAGAESRQTVSTWPSAPAGPSLTMPMRASKRKPFQNSGPVRLCAWKSSTQAPVRQGPLAPLAQGYTQYHSTMYRWAPTPRLGRKKPTSQLEVVGRAGVRVLQHHPRLLHAAQPLPRGLVSIPAPWRRWRRLPFAVARVAAFLRRWATAAALVAGHAALGTASTQLGGGPTALCL